MQSQITQKEIGKRLVQLRKSKGYSQQDVAKFLKIPRSSVAQLELGNRNITVDELMKLSEFLSFPVEQLLAKKFGLPEELPEEKTKKPKPHVRISIPKLQIPKFKNVLLYILEHCAGKPNVGETVLYKLLYFCDFNYYELYEEHLTGASYKKLPYGPVPQRMESILNQMIKSGKLKRIKTEYHGYPQTRFVPLEKADLTQLKASEKEVIDRVIDQLSDWSASAISDYSHRDMPWRASKDGETINYELAFYRESPFSVRNYGEEIEEA